MSNEDQTEKIELPDKGAREQAAKEQAAGAQATTPGTAQGTAPGSQAGTQASTPAYPAFPERPPAPTGPHLPAILLGLAVLAVAGFALADATLDLQVDWAVTGPIGILVVGAALVLLGAAGLAGNRRR